MVEIMRRPRIIRETARGLETMSLEDDFFQKKQVVSYFGRMTESCGQGYNL